MSELSGKVERFSASGVGCISSHTSQLCDRLQFVTPDQSPRGWFDGIALDEDGAGRLATFIKDVASSFNGGVGLVVVDALSDFLPGKVSENANEDMRPVMSRLAQVAQGTGVVLVVLHHWPKAAHSAGTQSRSGYQALTAARGASVISTKPRVVMTLEHDKQEAGSHKIQKVIGNDLPMLDPWTWETADPAKGGRGIFYWRLVPSAVPAPSSGAQTPDSILQPGRCYSFTAFTRKLCKLADTKRPSGSQKEQATAVLLQWEADHLICVDRDASPWKITLTSPEGRAPEAQSG
jgi:hypothetical protein